MKNFFLCVISNHQEIVFSILKHILAKRPSKTIYYQDLKILDHSSFYIYQESKISFFFNSSEIFLQNLSKC